MARKAGTVVGLLFLAHVAAAQFIQKGDKLVGTGAVGPSAYQGNSVAVSADGNTALIGGPEDNSVQGAAWVFTRSGGGWSQQGDKLFGAGAVGDRYVQQGLSVSISADGNTAIVGGPSDNSYTGAAWVFIRGLGLWTQQGSKLVGTGAVGASAQQGWSVAISGDGNTAIVGAYDDNSGAGAAWVFTRSGGVWSQQGSKLVGSGAIVPAYQGQSVAISRDGNTAIVGGRGDHSFTGAAWVFTRSNGVWTQQGSKLVGTGAVGSYAQQGFSVAISADGNTAIVGGPSDNFNAGAVWVFARNGGAWTQQGSKLVGSGAVGNAQLGTSVGVSADGNTAIVGGPADDLAGAAWTFTRSGGEWTQLGSKLVGSGAVGDAAQGTSVAISADGKTAVVGGYYDDKGVGAAWMFVANACAVPSITGQPQNQTIGNGQTATLSVTATGTAPLSFQWYQGSSIFGWAPVGANAPSFTTPALTASASFFVRVSNACGHEDSATATVSVTCTSPSITTQPQSQSIAKGQAATLSVTVGGTTPLSYQWYQGKAGDTSTPVGEDASTFTTAPLQATTSFWVRVSGVCGSADSATATVTISRGVRRHLYRAT